MVITTTCLFGQYRLLLLQSNNCALLPRAQADRAQLNLTVREGHTRP